MVILDCEVAWYGDPVFDVVFLINHLMIKALHLLSSAEELIAMVMVFWQQYCTTALNVVDQGFEKRLTHLLPMLLLARVDGKSPVEQLLIAIRAKTYKESLEMRHNVYHAAGEVMKRRGKCAGIIDEGGWWLDYSTNEEPFEVFIEAMEKAGYIPGKDVAFSLDIVVSHLFDGENYHFKLENKSFSPDSFYNLMVS